VEQDPLDYWIRLKLMESDEHVSQEEKAVAFVQRRALEQKIFPAAPTPPSSGEIDAPLASVEDIRGMTPPGEEDRTLAQLASMGPDPTGAKIDAVLAGFGQSTIQLARGPIHLASDIAKFFTEQDVLRAARELVDQVHRGAGMTADVAALNAGLTPEEIAPYKLAGNLIGYMAPILGSVKLASLILRSPVALEKWPFISSVITDSTAGLIFGGVFEEAEDWRQRGHHMVRESGLFGAGRIIIGGPIVAKTWRDKRFLSSVAHKEVASIFKQLEAGVPVHSLTKKQNRILNVMMNEEQYLSSSVAAQDMFNRSGPHAAMIQAIVDVGDRLTLGGVLRMATDNAAGTREIIKSARAAFPYLKFTPIKRTLTGVPGKPTHYDIFFGTRGLNNAQKAQLKAEGRFTGQMVRTQGGEADYLYLGLSKKGRAILERLDGSGKKRYVKQDNLVDLPNFLEKPLVAWDAPFKDFRAFYYETLRRLRDTRTGWTSEGDVIEAIRTGTMALDDGARRAFDVSGAIVYPEELGYASMRRAVSGREVSEAILREGAAAAGPTETLTYLTFDDIFMAWARERGIGSAKDMVAAKEAFTGRLRRELWESVPQADRLLYEKVLAEQINLIDNMRLPPKLLAHQKGFSWETLGDDTIMLREINSGARMVFAKTDDALGWLKGIVRTEAELPTIIPSMRLSMGLYNAGMPDPGSLYKFEKLASLNPAELPTAGTRNMWNWLQDVENLAQIPFWSKGMYHVDQGVNLMRAEMTPFAKEIESIWRGVNYENKVKLVEVWRRAEKEKWSTAQTARAMKKEGVPTAGVSAYIRARRINDRLFKETGLDANAYVDNYYSRILPFLESTHKRDVSIALRGAKGSPSDKDFWFEYTRTGDLAKVEMDPELVMQLYTRSVFWKKHVDESWRGLKRMAGLDTKDAPLRFKDLPDGKELLALRKKIDPYAKMDSPVVPGYVRKIVAEYLNAVKGTPHASYKSLGESFERMFNKLGVAVRPEIIQDMVHCLTAAQYGAYIGIRPWHIARNMTQVPWLMFGRLGNRHMGKGLEHAMSNAGIEEAFSEGVLRLAEAAVPAGDAVFRSLHHIPITGSTLAGQAIAGTISAMHRGGQLSRKVTQSMLAGYTSSDSLNRGWAYFWHKLHTGEALTKFETGKIGWDKFVDDGLPFFAPAVRDKFREIYRIHGREGALRFIGKTASDQVNFIYGGGVQPPWMQSVYARVLGTFGTWPLWAIENTMTQVLKHGTPQQVAGYYLRTATMLGVYGNIMLQTGYNLFSWIPPLSVLWAGGPYMDLLDAARRVISGPMDQKLAALQELGRLGLRVTLPGQSFYRDMNRVFTGEEPPEIRALGVFLGRTFDDYHWATNIIYDPTIPDFELPAVDRMRMEDAGVNRLNIPRFPPPSTPPPARPGLIGGPPPGGPTGLPSQPMPNLPMETERPGILGPPGAMRLDPGFWESIRLPIEREGGEW